MTSVSNDTNSVRVAVDVVAGILPGTPMPEFTQRWYITSKDWNVEDGMQQARILAEMNGKAQAWAMYLMLQPDRVNWVKTEWIWF